MPTYPGLHAYLCMYPYTHILHPVIIVIIPAQKKIKHGHCVAGAATRGSRRMGGQGRPEHLHGFLRQPREPGELRERAIAIAATSFIIRLPLFGRRAVRALVRPPKPKPRIRAEPALRSAATRLISLRTCVCTTEYDVPSRVSCRAVAAGLTTSDGMCSSFRSVVSRRLRRSVPTSARMPS